MQTASAQPAITMIRVQTAQPLRPIDWDVATPRCTKDLHAEAMPDAWTARHRSAFEDGVNAATRHYTRSQRVGHITNACLPPTEPEDTRAAYVSGYTWGWRWCETEAARQWDNPPYLFQAFDSVWVAMEQAWFRAQYLHPMASTGLHVVRLTVGGKASANARQLVVTADALSARTDD